MVANTPVVEFVKKENSFKHILDQKNTCKIDKFNGTAAFKS